eukprot:TRINITY_DN1585_c0_g1_i4.p1 TRINITY_DN1585_c0_g1~~TRINITY_DN1585_c0_g1_i4.p1  ORF type:complete len:302 (-),score=60.58 TRINITY_DN1585_c0_g1_i4:59-964(-)
MEKEVTRVEDIVDTNIPKDPDGRMYHIAAKEGEVSNRILTVGDPRRAEIIASSLDNPQQTFKLVSKRGFTIYTGMKNGVPVSIIATGMGLAMMDFLLRECSAITNGTLLIIRYGTCGSINSKIGVGSLALAKQSVLVTRNVDAFLSDSNNMEKYNISKPIYPDFELQNVLRDKVKKVLPDRLVETINATADSFYCSQGRNDPNFNDDNSNLIDRLLELHVDTLEMETFSLFHLANSSKRKIKVAALTIVLAQRLKNDFLKHEEIDHLERVGGEAVLNALTEIKLTPEEVMNKPECIWLKMK